MTGELHPTVVAALDKFKAAFGWKLLHFPQGDTSGFSRADLSAHGYCRFPHDGEPEPEFSAARRFLEQEGVMLLRYPRQDGQTGYFVAPIIPCP